MTDAGPNEKATIRGELAACGDEMPVLFVREDGSTFMKLMDERERHADVFLIADIEDLVVTYGSFWEGPKVTQVLFHRVDVGYRWGTHGPWESHAEMYPPHGAPAGPPREIDAYTGLTYRELAALSHPRMPFAGVVAVTVFAVGGSANVYWERRGFRRLYIDQVTIDSSVA